MTHLSVLKDHVQFLAQMLQPAKCIGTEGNVVWEHIIKLVKLPTAVQKTK